MKDEAGRVTIAGWYDDVAPLGEAERRAIAEAPQYDNELKSATRSRANRKCRQKLTPTDHEPSLNINGMSSGDVGELARNIIPTTASAVLDLRLVKGNDYQRQVERLISHIRKQGFYVIDRDPTDEERRNNPLIAKVVHRPGGYNAERTAMDLPISQAVRRSRPNHFSRTYREIADLRRQPSPLNHYRQPAHRHDHGSHCQLRQQPAR